MTLNKANANGFPVLFIWRLGHI